MPNTVQFVSSTGPATSTVTYTTFIVPNCTTTSGSNIVTTTGGGFIGNAEQGYTISGTGVSNSAVVQTVSYDGNTMTMSAPAFASGTISLTLTPRYPKATYSLAYAGGLLPPQPIPGNGSTQMIHQGYTPIGGAFPGITLTASATTYSLPFTAPSGATAMSVVVELVAGYGAGTSASVQLQGAIYSGLANGSTSWANIGTAAVVSVAGPVTVVSSIVPIFPMYQLAVASNSSSSGTLNFVVSPV